MEPSTQKARNLAKLKNLGFNVPRFKVISRNSSFLPLSEVISEFVILRGSFATEDNTDCSQAGQSKSVGPISRAQVNQVISKLFENNAIEEIIVQEFVDAPTGVLFCLSSEKALLEFSRIPRYVTDGIGEPFSAVFPNSIPHYKAIQDLLSKLYSLFGSCNVELSVEDNPKLFQVRPITAAVEVSDNLSEVKMSLQELPFSHLIQNEFSSDLEESPGFELELVELYCETKRRLLDAWNIKTKSETTADFVKIGARIFVNNLSSVESLPEGKKAYSLGSWIINKLYDYRKDKLLELSPNNLMEVAIALRILAALVERFPQWLSKQINKRLLFLRSDVREKLLSRLNKIGEIPTIGTSLKFESPISKDSYSLTWPNLKEADSQGKVIVPGEFTQGPFVILKTRGERPTFPNEKAVLVCSALYPEIYNYFPNIKAIVSEGGALTSHLAILAREQGMPLMIGVSSAMKEVDFGK